MANPRVSLFEELFELQPHNALIIGYMNGTVVAYQGDTEDPDSMDSKGTLMQETPLDLGKFVGALHDVLDFDIRLVDGKVNVGGQEPFSIVLYLPSGLLGLRMGESEMPVGIDMSEALSEYLRSGFKLIESTKEE